MDLEQAVGVDVAGGGGGAVVIFVAKKWPQLLAGTFGSMGGMIVGTVSAWPQVALRNVTESGDLGHIGPAQQFWTQVIVFIAAMFAVIPAGWLVDKFGRRWTIMALCVPAALGWLFIVLANGFSMLFIGRLITGLSMGGLSIASPVYAAEVASAKLKGNLGCSYQHQVIQGWLFVYMNGHSRNWLWLSIFCGIVPIPIIIAMYFLPESPTFLLAQGRAEEAKSALKWLRGARTVEQISPELEDIRKSMGKLSGGKGKIRGIFPRDTWRPLVALTPLLVAYQFGIIAQMTTWIQQIFNLAGIMWSAGACLIALGVSAAVGAFIASVTADRVSRKGLMGVSVVIFACAALPLGITAPWEEISAGDEPTAVGIIRLVVLLVAAFGFNLGLGPIPWLLLVEVTPPEARGKSGALAVLMTWSSAAVLVLIQAMLTLDTVGTFYWTSGVIWILLTVMSLYFLPETKESVPTAVMERISPVNQQ